MNRNILLTGFLLCYLYVSLGSGCFGSGSTDPDESDETLTDALYNGTWRYIGYAVNGVQYPLTEALYQGATVDQARISFRDYENEEMTDTWEYSEHDEQEDRWTAVNSGAFFTGSENFLQLYEGTAPGSGDLWEEFQWSVNNDTLWLARWNDQSQVFTLIVYEESSGPALKDIDYNDTWVYLEFWSYGTSYALADCLFIYPSVENATIEFKDYSLNEYEDEWTYCEFNEDSYYWEYGHMTTDPHLELYQWDGQVKVPWGEYLWSVPSNGDTLLLWIRIDTNRYYKLVRESAWSGP